ncbi:MarR family transcriptional regulator [Exiguobacterium indicum]|uniref:MarR family winged helix-turn-helix transcriptional regulator n=1 Tax=Exiguobacterium indicum TaxID=296995 RepID=UPI00073621B2|nr:MarR family transcriptional regulator [Exiguobacterium indicum]KTR62519.1 MarR family transcriptional regulator [Exiguobacterium indicum]
MKEILREIGMIARALDSISNLEFKELQLSKGQYVYIVRICENPGIIQEQLIDLIKVDRSTATRVLQKLENNGLIEKRSNLENKKNKNLFATEQGKAIYKLIIREHEYSNEVALSGFKEKEIEAVFRYVQRIRKNIEKDWEQVKKGHKRNY